MAFLRLARRQRGLDPLWSDRPLRRVHGLEPGMRHRPSGRGPPHWYFSSTLYMRTVIGYFFRRSIRSPRLDFWINRQK